MHENEALVRAGYDAFVRGDLDAVRGFLDPNVSWHVAGANPLAGVYRGHDELLALFTTIFEMTGGTVTLAARDILASEDHVIVLTTMQGKRGDRVLHDDGVAVFKIAGGKAIEVWTFAENQGVMDEFFS